MKGQVWKTKSGVLVVEERRSRFMNHLNGEWEWKIRAHRKTTLGRHGWLWLRNLREEGKT